MAFKFEKLKVWQKAIKLSNKVDALTKKFPKNEIYIPTSQIKRASDSIALNIAEGSTGQSNEEFDYLYKDLTEIIKMIQALRKTL